MSPVSLNFQGPYQLLAFSAPGYFFAQPVSKSAGIMLWTYPTKAGELAYYVATSGRFSTSMRTRIAGYLSGDYILYHPSNFALGSKVHAWSGLQRTGEQYRLLEYLEALPRIAPLLREFLANLRVYCAELPSSSSLAPRIAVALGDHFRRQPGMVGQYLDIESPTSGGAQAADEIVNLTGCSNVTAFPAELRA